MPFLIHGIFNLKHSLTIPLYLPEFRNGVGLDTVSILKHDTSALTVEHLHVPSDIPESVVHCNKRMVIPYHHKFVTRRHLYGIVRLLLSKVIVHHAIGNDRPAVTQVPPEKPPHAPLLRTGKLNPRLERLSLRMLRGRHKIFKLIGASAEHDLRLLRH